MKASPTLTVVIALFLPLFYIFFKDLFYSSVEKHTSILKHYVIFVLSYKENTQ